MEKETGEYIIDAGNSRVKIANFQRDELVDLQIVTIEELLKQENNFSKIISSNSILSSVLDEKQTKLLIELFNVKHILSQNTLLPFKNNYATPTSLGADRICNAAFASKNNKGNGVLIVDIGTCVKFDFLNAENEYLGGSISPGIHLRYKSMNDYTGKLPLLSDTDDIQLIGKNTKESMQSGVINGLRNEILGMIQQYQLDYPGLTTFMTGGDANLFDKCLENSIFVDENLTLKGLNVILEHNAD